MKPTALAFAAVLAAPIALAAQAPPPERPPRRPPAVDSERTSPSGPSHRRGPRSVDERRPAARDCSISIENPSGSLKVSGWDRAEVEVKGTVGPGGKLDFGGTEKRTHIGIDVQHGNMTGVESDLEVFVPAGCSVSVHSFGAGIAVTGVTGSVDAETVRGAITHSGSSREVRLQSVNGAVETTRPNGRVRVEAVNGPVTVRDAAGELEASTVNGTLLVAGGAFDRVQLESVSGPVRFEGAIAAKGALAVQTVSGTIDLVLPSGFGGEFSVSTFSGKVTNELGPAQGRKGDWLPGTKLTFTTGAGGARVDLGTLSGAINIRRKP